MKHLLALAFLAASVAAAPHHQIREAKAEDDENCVVKYVYVNDDATNETTGSTGPTDTSSSDIVGAQEHHEEKSGVNTTTKSPSCGR